MIPVVGLDVAKGATEGQAFLDKGRPYGPHFQITHTAEGLEQLQVLLDDLAAQTHCPPTVILESTGHYHVPVVRFLEAHGYAYVLLNPLIPYQAKQSSLRKVKTDAVDAFRLGQLFYKEELSRYGGAVGSCGTSDISRGSGRPSPASCASQTPVSCASRFGVPGISPGG